MRKTFFLGKIYTDRLKGLSLQFLNSSDRTSHCFCFFILPKIWSCLNLKHFNINAELLESSGTLTLAQAY